MKYFCGYKLLHNKSHNVGQFSGQSVQFDEVLGGDTRVILSWYPH